MIVNGQTPSKAIESIGKEGLEPETRMGRKAAEFLRQTPSLNIIPFRSRSAPKPQAFRYALWQRGEQIGWELLCTIRPKPYCIVTLANGISVSPWKTILENSGQLPRDSDCERHIGYVYDSERNYREAKLREGPLKGTLVIGLPAVVRDNIDDVNIREGITRPLFEILWLRLQHHGLIR